MPVVIVIVVIVVVVVLVIVVVIVKVVVIVVVVIAVLLQVMVVVAVVVPYAPPLIDRGSKCALRGCGGLGGGVGGGLITLVLFCNQWRRLLLINSAAASCHTCDSSENISTLVS